MMELSQPGPRRVYCVQDTYPKWSNTTYFWDPLHAIAAKVLLALLLVHLVVHWKWLYRFFRKRGKDEGVARRMEDAHGD